MKVAANITKNWLQRQELRLQHIKLWQRGRKVGSEIIQSKPRSATLKMPKERKQHRRMLQANITKNWLQRQELRLQHIKLWQRGRKVGSEIIQSKPRSATLKMPKERKQHRRMLQVRNIFRRGTKQDYEHSGSFLEAIGPVLVLAQLFALMPVCGVLSKTASEIYFSWKCVRTWYALLVIACLGPASLCTITFAFHEKFSFDTVEAIVFYVSIFLIALGFFQLARKWPALMLQWERIESKLPPLKTQMQRAALAQRIKMITLVATMCSVVEHLLSMLGIIYYVNACPAIPGHPIQSFLHSNWSQYFYFFEYTNLAGILGKVLNILSTFAWNFNDIFVMAVSVALSARFRQLNEHMLRVAKRPTTEKFWIENRINYRNLCKLCEATDDTISVITLLCFSNNLFFICGKILKSLQKKPSYSHTAYFWFSLGFLLMRTLMLSLYSAEIHDESRRPLIVFRGVPSEFWCPELKRFSEEVTTDLVALSGMKFFHLTRGLVLSVAGSIVTYELVLLQFNKEDKVGDCYEN